METVKTGVANLNSLGWSSLPKVGTAMCHKAMSSVKGLLSTAHEIER